MAYREVDALRAHWDEFAPLFEASFERGTVQLVYGLREHLRLDSARAVIEVGAGAGAGAQALLERLPSDARLVVTDLSPAMVARARAKLLPAGRDAAGPAVEVDVANAEALPYPDGTFDRLQSNLNLMLVTDPDQALAEAFRVLQPGARAAWSVWGRPAWSPLVALPAQAAEKAGIELAERRSNFHLNDRAALRARIAKAGFHSVRTWYHGFVLDLRDGQEFADLTLSTPGWRETLAEVPDEQVEAMRQALAALGNAQFEAGGVIGFDALMVVADK